MKLIHCLVLFLLSQSLVLAAEYCPNQLNGQRVLEVSVEHLIPTQYGMGKDVVKKIYDRYHQEGFVKAIRERFARKPLPVILGPTRAGRNAYYVKDNHHTVIPVQMALDSGLISNRPDSFGITGSLVCIALDERGAQLRWEEFIQSLYQGKFDAAIGYFRWEDRVTLAVAGSESNFLPKLSSAYEQMFSHSLSGLEDVPVRSTVADIFTSKKLLISGSWFNEYIEFKLGEKVTFPHPSSKAISTLQVFKSLFGREEVSQYWISELKKDLKDAERSKFQKAFEDGRVFYRKYLQGGSPFSETEQNELLGKFLGF